jgi:hypothetical protein
MFKAARMSSSSSSFFFFNAYHSHGVTTFMPVRFFCEKKGLLKYIDEENLPMEFRVSQPVKPSYWPTSASLSPALSPAAAPAAAGRNGATGREGDLAGLEKEPLDGVVKERLGGAATGPRLSSLSSAGLSPAESGGGRKDPLVSPRSVSFEGDHPIWATASWEVRCP